MDTPVLDGLTRDLLLAQDGDLTAFTRVVKVSQPDIVRFCQWTTGKSTDVDDIAQETLLKVFKNLESFRGESSGRSWILSIARRVCLDHVRHHARHERSVGAWRDLRRPAGASDAGASSVDLADLIARLHDPLKEAFVLVRVFGFSYAEVATTLELPVGTVQSRVARARSALAEMLDPGVDVSATRGTPARRRAG